MIKNSSSMLAVDLIIIFYWEKRVVSEGELSQHHYCSKNCLVVREVVPVWSCQDCPIFEPLIYSLLTVAHSCRYILYLWIRILKKATRTFYKLWCTPQYPLSVSHRSPSSECFANASLKIMLSFQSPGGYGPLHQQMSPVLIHNPTSYRYPLFLNL